jgi:hypothetical protein
VAFERKEYSRYGSDAQAEIKGITLPFSYGLMLRRQGRRRAAHRQHSRNKLLDWGVAQVCLYYQLAIFVNLLDLHTVHPCDYILFNMYIADDTYLVGQV